MQCWAVVSLILEEFIMDKGASRGGGGGGSIIFFLHVQSVEISSNTDVIKVTITQTYGNKMHAMIVLTLSKLQETSPKLPHLIFKIG